MNTLDRIIKSIDKGDTSVLMEVNNLLIDVRNEGEIEFELRLLIEKARIFKISSKFEEGLRILDNADALIEKNIIESSVFKAKVNQVRGNIYYHLGNYQKAKEFLLKALDVFEKEGLKKDSANLMLTLGQQFVVALNYDKAEYYLNKSLEYYLALNPNYNDWSLYRVLGHLKLQTSFPKEAKLFFEKAIASANSTNHQVGLGLSLSGLAQSEFSLKNLESALKIIDKSIETLEATGIESLIISTKLAKMPFLTHSKASVQILELLNSIIDSIKEERMLISCYHFYSEAYEMQGNFELSLKYFRKHISLKEKIVGLEVKKHSEEIEAKFQNKLKEREKEIFRLQKVEMEQKALRAQLNPHFFFNSLNSINKFITENDAENASKFLFKFSSLMRKTLENSEESFITIEEEVDYLKDYLSLEQLRFNFSFQFEIIVDQEIEDDFIKIPTMMLQPYVENCIKHGVNGVENGLIKIEFIQEDECIKCIIEDNGKGRGESKSSHKSMGTSILENRMKNLKEQFNLDFNFNIEDIKNNKNNACGTKVILVIPELNSI